ncbi:uncharacterized protein [Anoplolepis gracilipes]|uniref:uncharacterized protein n=1 Tax=Anoplolepis gracilipes TaxID=354296 RepID=UPI003BA1BA11
MVINLVATITSAILSVYYDKRFRICMKKLAVVDDTLEELGSPKIYQNMYTWSKRTVIAWIVYSNAYNFYDVIWWVNRKETASWAFIISYLLNHPLHVNMLMDLIFITILWYIGNRFDKINEHMQHFLMNEHYGLRNRWKKPLIFHTYISSCTEKYKRVLWTLMHLHLELCRIARELNGMFGAQMAFEMASYLFYLIELCYYLFGMLVKKQQEEIIKSALIGISLWTFSFVARLCTVNYICESVGVKANNINKITHYLTNTSEYASVRKEIYQFTLQAIHSPLRFTGMGLFYFGNKFLQKFCLTIVTLVIIMVQMSEIFF